MEDHPRIRGEHALALLLWRGEAGSSPHTRGARGRLSVGTPDSRIIPAYAGSTSDPPATTRRTADHPRIRGEHMLAMARFKWEGGSSPHTRGAHLRRLDGENEGGIIPAYAGSTPAAPPRAVVGKDHPRIRGEHSALARPSASAIGSSPHTRGARSKLYVCIYKHADHPRIRGEHRRPGGPFGQRRGSSPHTRGAPGRRGRGETGVGIIPAYAGSTPRRIRTFPHIWDHPRIRGEHFHTAVEQGARDGSSPHTRGAPAGA